MEVPLSSNATTVISSPETFRNSRFLLGIMLLVSIAAMIMSPLMLIVALTGFFPLHQLSVNRVVSGFSWLLACLAFARMGWALLQITRAMAHNHARLDQNGVHFSLSAKKQPIEESIAWYQIASIQHRRINNNNSYTIGTADGSSLQFGGFTFYRPKKLACKIAAATGQPISEIK
jgi:hypothetical protein